MARVKNTTCPNCSAALVVKDARVVKCEYCGKEVELEKESRPPQVSAPRPAPVKVTVATPKSPKVVVIAVLIPVIFAGGMIAFSVMMAKRAQQGVSDPAGGHSPKGESIHWESRILPALARVNGDEVDDIISRYTLYENERSNVYIGAFDGQSFKRLWKAGPFGDTSKDGASQHTHFVVTGSRVAVTDHATMVHILDLATGTEQRAVRLSDRATRGCAPPDGSDKAWIEVADEQNVSIDLTTGAIQPMERPEYCRKEVELTHSSRCWHQDFQRSRQALADCIAPSKLGKSKSFNPEYGLKAEGKVVALGHKQPGTRVPMVAGYDGTKPIWVRNIAGDAQANVGEGTPAVADMAFGHLIIQYQLDKSWRLISLDPATGNTQWDAPIPNTDWADDSDLVLLSKTNVYLPNKQYLHIYDISNGNLLGTIGKLY